MRSARFTQILVATLFFALPLRTASAQTTFFRPFGSRPVHGQVIDADSQQPIAGAVAQLNTWVACGVFQEILGHQTTLHSPPLEAVTDREGRFTITGLRVFAPCLRADYYERLRVIAPGYLPDFAEEKEWFESGAIEKSIRSGLFPLQRIRYRYELALLPRPFVATPDGRQPGSLWEGMIAQTRALPLRPLGELGAFVVRPGATFTRVAVIDRSIVVQDGTTGALYAWNPRGDPLPVSLPADAGRSLLSGGRDRLVLAGPDTIEVSNRRNWQLAQPHQRGVVRALAGPVREAIAERWVPKLLTLEDGGRQIGIYDVVERKDGAPPDVVPAPPLAVADRFPADTASIACMAVVGGSLHHIAVFARVDNGLALFLWWPHDPDVRNWKVQRIPLEGKLPGAITACGGSQRGIVYVAPQTGPLMRIEIKQYGMYAKQPWMGIVNAPPHNWSFPNFSSLAVDDKVPAYKEEPGAVYAVSNSQAVYRFNLDLEPDQRIEFSPVASH